MWPFQKKLPKTQGEIGYYGLSDWWLSTFTEEERDYIESVFQPFGLSPGERPLTQGSFQGSFHLDHQPVPTTTFLSNLASWFKKSGDRHIAHRMLEKAEALSGDASVLDLHFLYHTIIEVFYKDRDTDPTAFDAAISACEKQIALAPQAALSFKRTYPGSPLSSHKGFEQLAIICEKQKNYPEAVRLSKLANEQGWDGDWEKRIARCEGKLRK